MYIYVNMFAYSYVQELLVEEAAKLAGASTDICI